MNNLFRLFKGLFQILLKIIIVRIPETEEGLRYVNKKKTGKLLSIIEDIGIVRLVENLFVLKFTHLLF